MEGYHHIVVEPLTGSIGAEIRNVDITRPSEAQVTETRRALAEYAVLSFPDQNMSPGQQTEFTAHFGKLRRSPNFQHMADFPEVLVLKREANRSEIAFGGVWHADETFWEVPCNVVSLYGVEVPPYGGDTLFAGCGAAYDALSPGMKALCDQLVVMHSGSRSYGNTDKLNKDQVKGQLTKDVPVKFAGDPCREVEHPLVCVHPVTGRKLLWATNQTMIRFRDMTEEESRPLLQFLFEHVTNPNFTCRVRYRKGSLTMWDNRQVLHMALSDYSVRREMHRVQVDGPAPFGPAMPLAALEPAEPAMA